MRHLAGLLKKRKGLPIRVVAVFGLLIAFLAGFAAHSGIGRAQAAAGPAGTAPSTPLALQIAGKAGPPLTLSPDSIPSDYRLVGLIDAQGKSGYYVSRGDMLAIGSDNYLLAYEVTIFNDEAGEMKIARGDSLTLSLINLHTLEIISHIGPLPAVATPPPPRRQDQQ
ncbi:MAG TPA: hypothetical protein VFW40_05420 [Capsulimonadaceae bacterium]|nr:hypothetical protein [Capsulimonadaceae bacterium]